MNSLRFSVCAIALMLLAGCLPTTPGSPTASATSTPAATPTLESISTPTLPIGTWPVTITGMVYDASAGRDKPIVNAQVTYARSSIVINSETKQTRTDAQGHYTVAMMMHDTDRVLITVQAAGFAPYTATRNGVSFFPSDEQRGDVGLMPLNPVTPAWPTPIISP